MAEINTIGGISSGAGASISQLPSNLHFHGSAHLKTFPASFDQVLNGSSSAQVDNTASNDRVSAALETLLIEQLLKEIVSEQAQDAFGDGPNADLMTEQLSKVLAREIAQRGDIDFGIPDGKSSRDQ